MSLILSMQISMSVQKGHTTAVHMPRASTAMAATAVGVTQATIAMESTVELVRTLHS